MTRKWKQVSPVERLGRWRVPQATMNRRGDIKLSRVAWELLEQARYCFVLYEPATRTIGLRPSRAHIRDTFELKPDGKNGAHVVNVACLRVDHKVIAEHTIRFRDVRLDDEGTLILELAQATPAFHGRRVGAFHNERKVPQLRQCQPRPNWLADVIKTQSTVPQSTGPQASRLQMTGPQASRLPPTDIENADPIQSASGPPHASETLAVQSGETRHAGESLERGQ